MIISFGILTHKVNFTFFKFQVKKGSSPSVLAAVHLICIYCLSNVLIKLFLLKALQFATPFFFCLDLRVVAQMLLRPVFFSSVA